VFYYVYFGGVDHYGAQLAGFSLTLRRKLDGVDGGSTGSAQGVFGSGGNANFLSHATAIAATFFFATCMAMVYIHSNTTRHGLDFSNVKQSLPAKTQQAPANGGKTDTVPAAPKQQ